MNKSEGRELLSFASDLELLSSSLSAGLPLANATVYLVEHGSAHFRSDWQKLSSRLQAELPMQLALHDFKIAAASYWSDQLCEVLIACDVYKSTIAAAEVLKLAHLVRQVGEVTLESQRRISAAKSIAWLALSAPWLLLIMLSLRTENLQVFLKPEGMLIVLAGAAASLTAFLLSQRISSVAPLKRVFA